MARAKKEAALTPEERLQAALVPDWEWPRSQLETVWRETESFSASASCESPAFFRSLRRLELKSDINQPPLPSTS